MSAVPKLERVNFHKIFFHGTRTEYLLGYHNVRLKVTHCKKKKKEEKTKILDDIDSCPWIYFDCQQFWLRWEQ